MSQTNGADVDLDRIVHGLHLEITGMASRLAEKDVQTRTMLQTIGRYVEDRIKLATAPLLKRIDELEKRGIEYRGVYQRAQSYRRGSLITHDGSVWACIEDAAVNESPGSHPSRWQMALRGEGREQRLPTKGTRGPPQDRRP